MTTVGVKGLTARTSPVVSCCLATVA